MADTPRKAGGATRAVHGGERDRRTSDALTTPIHQTSTFTFEDSAEVRAYAEGRLERDEYGRYSNPTWRAVEGSKGWGFELEAFVWSNALSQGHHI